MREDELLKNTERFGEASEQRDKHKGIGKIRQRKKRKLPGEREDKKLVTCNKDMMHKR